ncbi:hypothetical protein HME9304_00693 [Flagellimonas maritima]|uniref:IFT52 GIFT domain-containing protein n=1 Tax=Flagellimonas maritima TaxID=1383885 RepID=A0A2Z4LPI9_9FLAO|nr:hypothetical protein [Allomuricauda aurantiaca]AWX43702.1 hypothetical protein HME9304_00693 [Allomuricauda aurantiaca]
MISSFHFIVLIFTSNALFGQPGKVLVYDTYHNHYDLSKEYSELLSDTAKIVVNTKEISSTTLSKAYGLLLLFPKTKLNVSEKMAIVDFLNSGGSLLLVFDEGKRTPFNRINDVISSFGIEVTEYDLPYLHNCGAMAPRSNICANQREIPYSGGRAVIGGTAISKVLMEGDFVHSAYVELDAG